MQPNSIVADGPKVFHMNLTYEIRTRNATFRYEIPWTCRLPTSHPSGSLTKKAIAFLAEKHHVLPQEVAVLGMKEAGTSGWYFRRS